MEPLKYLKYDKLNVKRLKVIRNKIYKTVYKCDVTYSPSNEPVPFKDHTNLKYKKCHEYTFWGKLFSCAWFNIKGIVPEEAKGKHVVLHINIGGEGLTYTEDGEPKDAITFVTSEIDKYSAPISKSIIEISDSAKGNEVINLYMDAGYNGYYNILKGYGVFRYANIDIVDDEMKDFYYDFLTIACLKIADKNRSDELETVLLESYNHFLNNDIKEAKKVLSKLLNSKPSSDLSFTAIGHSHLDLSWLWPLRETKRKAQRTFSNQINNSKRYKDYVYGASQPWQFEYIKNNYPKQFQSLKEMYKNNQFEPQGGMYVECDTNITSGESLIRQFLYGKAFFKKEFNEDMRICWLPDVFGYNGNLPQLIKKSGLDYFFTIKLSWNEHNRFPYRSFNWIGVDGSNVLVHMAPDETYNSCGSPCSTHNARKNYTEMKEAKEALLVYGIGDGGGGPGEGHIEMVKRQKSLDNSPKVSFGKAIDFFDRLEKRKEKLPTYKGELYLEKHQGTYTTQGRNKWFNRKMELLLQETEELSVLASTKGLKYPKEDFDRIWKEVMLYQFHDILPGSSINRVYEETRTSYKKLYDELTLIRNKTLSYLSNEGNKKLLYNPTSYERNYIYKNEVVNLKPFESKEAKGELIKTSFKEEKGNISNGLLSLVFNDSGEIISIKSDKGFEYSNSYINRLNMYYDKRLYYNAWDIYFKYYEKNPTTLKSYKYEIKVNDSSIERINYYKHGKTKITQSVILNYNSKIICFKTNVYYNEKNKMLRAEFNPAIYSDEVLCNIQMSNIKRSTKDDTKERLAQYEICAQKFISLNKDGRSVSLLNDSKYGHRVKNGIISLNLLRSPKYPDPKADIGDHEFTYAFMVQDNYDLKEVIKEAEFLNKDVIVYDGLNGFDSIASVSNDSIIIETIKEAEDKNGYIIRLYESIGTNNKTSLKTIFKGKPYFTNLVEEGEIEADLNNLDFTPYEIKTIKIKNE